MWCAECLQWPVLWLPGGALRTWSWVSPGEWRWRTGRKVMLACGGLRGESEPQPSEPLSRSTLSPKSNGGLEGRRGSDSWRSSSGWHAAPRWLTTGRWWREPPECLSDRRDNRDGASLVHSSVHQDSWDEILRRKWTEQKCKWRNYREIPRRHGAAVEMAGVKVYICV